MAWSGSDFEESELATWGVGPDVREMEENEAVGLVT